jgi:Lar family restriction alleviation protein
VEKLMWCPFCGSRVVLSDFTDVATGKKGVDISCDYCGARVSFADTELQEKQQRESLAEVWNHRAEGEGDMSCPFCGGEVTEKFYAAEDPEFDMDECGLLCEHCGVYISFWDAVREGDDVRQKTYEKWRCRAKGRRMKKAAPSQGEFRDCRCPTLARMLSEDWTGYTGREE